MTAEPFPDPDPDAQAVSRALVRRIESAVDAAGGWLGFERYMQMALYEPGLGYYSAGSAKLGPGGDFTTAPEQGDWLAETLAGFIGATLETLDSASVLEIGAGSGALAAGLLEGLAARGHAAVDYAILETSADLRARQAALLDARGVAARWIDRPPDAPFRGVVVANEVADALPVARFLKSGGRVLPLGIERGDRGLAIAPGPPDDRLAAAVAAIERELGEPLPEGYRSEICLMLEPWLESVLAPIRDGGLVLVDYGLPRRDYYRAERADGTLICHYRQRAHADPLFWPGLQDITAWVDFSAVAAAGQRAGFTLAGFTTQAQFLLASIAADPALAARQPGPAAASALQTLVLPGEMGERFKLAWLTRDPGAPGLPGRDFRNWL